VGNWQCPGVKLEVGLKLGKWWLMWVGNRRCPGVKLEVVVKVGGSFGGGHV
jgi:hypothetical protein